MFIDTMKTTMSTKFDKAKQVIQNDDLNVEMKQVVN